MLCTIVILASHLPRCTHEDRLATHHYGEQDSRVAGKLVNCIIKALKVIVEDILSACSANCEIVGSIGREERNSYIYICTYI